MRLCLKADPAEGRSAHSADSNKKWQRAVCSLPDQFCNGRDLSWLRSVWSDLRGPGGGFSLTTASQYTPVNAPVGSRGGGGVLSDFLKRLEKRQLV